MLKQSLQQKMLQKLSPQQIQLMKLLQLPTVALEQRIKEELEGNPALDEGRTDKEEEEEDPTAVAEPALGEALGDAARDTLGENTLMPRSLVDAFSWNPLFNPFDTASRSFCPSSAWVL